MPVRRIDFHAAIAAVIWAAIPPTAASAQPAPAAARSAPIDGSGVARAVKALLDKYYVLEGTRAGFDAWIDAGLASGRYAVDDPEELLKRLNDDLHAVTPDKHLGLMYDPKASREIAAAPRSGADDAPPSPADILAAERRNHGIAQLRVLPGNIRYLESDGFIWAGENSERAYDDAMRFLSGGDAVIIDLRKNGGGSPDAVRYLVSHFLAPNTPLMTFELTTSGGSNTASLPRLRAPSLRGKPLYVLTSSGSASAAEEFIGHVKGYALGELIGENSAGAGFRNEFFSLPDGFVISISVGQAILASTGKGWEGVGFAPDTAVPVDQALDAAQVRALRRLATTADPARRQSLEAKAALISARLKPVKTALPLSGYAGTYGERTVTASGETISIQRRGGPVSKLTAIGPNQFIYDNDGESTLSFDVAGDRAIALHLVRGDGSKVDSARTD